MDLNEIRRYISLLFFILFVLLFLGGDRFAIFLSGILTPFQLVPSVISIITKPASLFIAGLLFTIIISFIFGRVYCSFICPLGILQDMIIFISRKTGFKLKHSYRKPLNWLRYSILLITIVTASLGSFTILNLLDPHSIFGRIMTNTVSPPLTVLNNLFIDILKIFDIHSTLKITHKISNSILIITMIFFLAILFLSLKYGRLYCNSICPVGSMLSILSKVSLFKFIIDPDKCTNCRLCVTVCKAGCINPEDIQVNKADCINCFNCLIICPQSAVSYRPGFNTGITQDYSPSRRRFILASVSVMSSVFIAANVGIIKSIKKFILNEKLPVTPPGSLGFEHFTSACTACHLCVSVCPTKVITPALTAYGIAGMIQPVMDYHKSFCKFECNLCGSICPTGAIIPLTLKEKQLTQLGKARIMKDRCVVYTKKKNCTGCGEFCPTRAVYTTKIENNIRYPETNPEYCIGCGICEHACPTNPKSVIVEPNPVHGKAKKYIETKKPAIKPVTTSDKEFPF